MRSPELLCPAKNAETARAAILCGADAVYIGAEAFGARAAAANSTKDIADLCRFAHVYGCRVYAALNTILKDGEIPRAAKLSFELAEAGVDALIVQDLGLLEYGVAPIPLHASTQCHIDTPEKAKFLEACGFSALVAARELSLSQISAIRKALLPETRLECFVHGALCVSYSGQCRLSYAAGGRSGNRGECAQPCRMKYELLDANGNTIAPPAHYLSLRDMNRSASVGEMMDVGIDIFKIEGRLKDENYVKNTAAFYRKIIDAELEKRDLPRPSRGECRVQFEPDPEKTFSRSFCEYHLHGTQAGCASVGSPKARGKFVGTAGEVFAGGFKAKNAEKIFSNGDGLFFESEGGGTLGAAVSKVAGEKVFVGMPGEKIAIPKNAKIFRNRDTAFERDLAKPCSRKIKTEISLAESGGKFELKMRLCGDEKISASLELGELPAAQKPEAAREALSENLCKLGGTAFEAKFNCAGAAPFLKLGEINAARRALAAKLEGEILRLCDMRRKSFAPRKPDFSTPFAKFAETDARANALNSFAEKFYSRFGLKISERAAESRPPRDLKGSRVMRTKHCVLRELGLCKKTSAKRLAEPLVLKGEFASLELHFDCRACEMDVIFR